MRAILKKCLKKLKSTYELYNLRIESSLLYLLSLHLTFCNILERMKIEKDSIVTNSSPIIKLPSPSLIAVPIKQINIPHTKAILNLK